MKHKLEKLNAILQKTLSELIIKKFPSEMIVISDLLVSQNYRTARVYLKTTPIQLQKINQERIFLQKELSDTLKLKYTPVLTFLIDDNYLDNIDKLFEKIER